MNIRRIAGGRQASRESRTQRLAPAGRQMFAQSPHERRPRTAWHLIPSPSVEEASPGPGSPSPPLLEKEWDVCGETLVAYLPDPFGIHGPSIAATLSTADHPIDAVKG